MNVLNLKAVKQRNENLNAFRMKYLHYTTITHYIWNTQKNKDFMLTQVCNRYRWANMEHIQREVTACPQLAGRVTFIYHIMHQLGFFCSTMYIILSDFMKIEMQVDYSFKYC